MYSLKDKKESLWDWVQSEQPGSDDKERSAHSKEV